MSVRWLGAAVCMLASAAICACHAPRLEILDVALPSEDAIDNTTFDDAADAGDVLHDADPLMAPTRSCPDPGERGCARVAVSGGTFVLGTPAGVATSPEQPNVTVSGFAIDAYEVTVARFRRFANEVTSAYDATGALRRFSASYSGGTTVMEVDGTTLVFPFVSVRTGCNWTDTADSSTDQHPIDCIDWRTAFAFCVWDGGRLPTEAEREWAARWWNAGTTPRTYPWGTTSPGTSCDFAQWNFCPGADGRGTLHVGSLPSSVTSGVYDLGGNVEEWVADTYVDYAPQTAPNECWGRASYMDPVCYVPSLMVRTSRGGSFTSTRPPQLLSTARVNANPNQRGPNQGFRCVR